MKETRKKRNKVTILIDNTFVAQKDLYSFVHYLQDHKQERLFQALRNWLGCGFLIADGKDTFYMNNIDNICETGEKVEKRNDLQDLPKQDLPKDRKTLQRNRKTSTKGRHKVQRLDKTTPTKPKKNRKKVL